MIGKTLSHYRILRKLGEGGMGEVYQALDTTLDREVALKILPEELAKDPERRKRFQREAKAVAALKHPNIVTIHSVEEADGIHFITMELVDGETLASRMGEGGVDLDTFFEIAVPLTEAIASAHAKGVTHRDLKPANIMFDADGRVKILDFGLAKLFETRADTAKTVGPDSSTAEGRVIGTAAYMSPEQAEGVGVDHRSDIFSLGIIFYEMLTGKKPFEGKTTISTLSSILRDTPAPVSEFKPGLPRHLSRIIRRCLEKEPDRRFQTALDLHNDLRDLRHETRDPSSLSGVSSIGAPAGAPSRGGLGRLIKIGVPALIVVIAVVATLMLRGPTTEIAESKVMRIAVVPFENLGAEEDDYFADGITDEITAKLANISALAVISRASARKYKGMTKDTRTIGAELRVDFILTGTIRWDKSGGLEKVRITPELVKVADDANVWASTYEREIDEIFSVQADISRQIASALDVTLGGGEAAAPPPTNNVTAYQLYLRSLRYDPEDEVGIRLSIELLEKATQDDPSFALAWANLSIYHSGMYHYGYERTPARLEQAKSAADRSLALDPQLKDAHLARGYFYYWGHRQYGRALEAVDVAERLSPNDPQVMSLKSFILRRQGKLEECLRYMMRSFELDPQNSVTCRDIGHTLLLLRRYDEAIEYNEKAILIAPDFWNSYVSATYPYLAMGDTTSAARLLKSAPHRKDTEFKTEAAWVWYWLRYDDRLIALGTSKPDEMLWEQESAMPAGMWAAMGYEGRGDDGTAESYYTRALAVLQKQIENLPDDHRLHSSVGIVYAALGRKQDAIRHGKRAAELMPMSRDYMNGASTLWFLATIHARVGEAESAFEEIETLLSENTFYTARTVRLEPGFESLRSHPKYEELLARYRQGLP